mgnify:FL=1
MRYQCQKYKKEIELTNQTLIVINGEVVIKEAQCCDKQMEQTTESDGMPNIIRNENYK